MFYKYSKIASLIIITALSLLLPGRAFAQYRVSGVVEFSYHDFETKTGDTRTSQTYWTQNYVLNVGGSLWDPRFLQFNAGVGYSVNTYTSQSSADYHTLNYNLNTSFFPGMKISWDLFGSKSTQSTQSTTNIAGYDVDTTSYGGTLNLHLSRVGLGGNNNNSNNSNSNNSNSNNNYNKHFSLTLPDIMISRIHTDSESLSLTSPYHETRDNTAASLTYKVKSVDLKFDWGLENYKNLVTGSSYDAKSANLATSIPVSQDADLQLTGRLTERDTNNLTYFNQKDDTQSYTALLNFKEKDRLRHYYRYDFSEESTEAWKATTQRGEAQVVYGLSDDLSLHGGLNYNMQDIFSKASGSTPEKRTNIENGGAVGGATYRKKYTPDFLGPFTMDTSYDFNYGFSNVSSSDSSLNGGGYYYTNEAGLGLRSTGWKFENLAVSYHFNNKRDNSPLANNIRQQIYSMNFSSTRIVRTVISGSSNYTVQDSQVNDPTRLLQLTQNGGGNQQHRAFTYDVRVDHKLTPNLNVAAGATRGQTSTTTNTLSTLTTPSKYVTLDDVYFGEAKFSYALTRFVRYRAEVREEYRSTQTTATQSHILSMNLDYRIRLVLINLEYRLRQDMPDNTLRTTQQYYYVKLTRPF